jgi:hypothetical protein
MKEGFIVYESLCCYSEYIKQIDDTLGAVVWKNQQDENKS